MDNTAYLSNNVPFDYKGLLYVLSLKISNKNTYNCNCKVVECKHYLYPFLKSSVKVNPLKTLHAYILYINFKSTCMYFHIYICLSNSLIHVLHVCNFDPSWSNSYTTWQNIDMELISLVFTLLNFRSSYVTTVLLFFERGRWSIFF